MDKRKKSKGSKSPKKQSKKRKNNRIIFAIATLIVGIPIAYHFLNRGQEYQPPTSIVNIEIAISNQRQQYINDAIESLGGRPDEVIDAIYVHNSSQLEEKVGDIFPPFEANDVISNINSFLSDGSNVITFNVRKDGHYYLPVTACEGGTCSNNRS